MRQESIHEKTSSTTRLECYPLSSLGVSLKRWFCLGNIKPRPAHEKERRGRMKGGDQRGDQDGTCGRYSFCVRSDPHQLQLLRPDNICDSKGTFRDNKSFYGTFLDKDIVSLCSKKRENKSNFAPFKHRVCLFSECIYTVKTKAPFWGMLYLLWVR